MGEWIVQRPARIWIETTVKADTLEDALELAEKDITNGDFTEVAEVSEVIWDEYWVKDDKGEIYA